MKKLLIILGLLVLLLGVKMTSDQILYPTVIEETPFPGETIQDITSVNSSGGSSIPTTTKSTGFKQRVIAHETISQSLNTLSKKINGVFEFLKMGAIKIGEYINGVSGEIKISPDGIVARNKSGDTTFAIDGDTGNATFKGSVIAKDFLIADEKGLIGVNVFPFEANNYLDEQTMNGTGDWNDVDNTSQTFTLTRDSNVLFFCSTEVETSLGMGWRYYRIIVKNSNGVITNITSQWRLYSGGPIAIVFTGSLLLNPDDYEYTLQHKEVVDKQSVFQSIYKSYIVLGN